MSLLFRFSPKGLGPLAQQHHTRSCTVLVGCLDVLVMEGFEFIQESVHWSPALRPIEEYGQHASFIHFLLGGDGKMPVLKHGLTHCSKRAGFGYATIHLCIGPPI